MYLSTLAVYRGKAIFGFNLCLLHDWVRASAHQITNERIALKYQPPLALFSVQ